MKISIDKIVPSNYRKAGNVDALAQSIKHTGLIQPIIVFKNDDNHYEVIDGHRRLLAVQLNGEKTIQAVVEKKPNAVMRMAANQNRKDATIHETATYMKQLLEEGVTDETAMAQMLGIQRQHVGWYMKLAQMTDEEMMILEDRLGSKKEIFKFINSDNDLSVIKDKIHSGQVWNDNITEYLLADALFDLEDTALVPDMGDCLTCPFNSSNGIDLFGTSGRCMKPSCYKEKAEEDRKEKALNANLDGSYFLYDCWRMDEEEKYDRQLNDSVIHSSFGIANNDFSEFDGFHSESHFAVAYRNGQSMASLIESDFADLTAQAFVVKDMLDAYGMTWVIHNDALTALYKLPASEADAELDKFANNFNLSKYLVTTKIEKREALSAVDQDDEESGPTYEYLIEQEKLLTQKLIRTEQIRDKKILDESVFEFKQHYMQKLDDLIKKDSFDPNDAVYLFQVLWSRHQPEEFRYNRILRRLINSMPFEIVEKALEVLNVFSEVDIECRPYELNDKCMDFKMNERVIQLIASYDVPAFDLKVDPLTTAYTVLFEILINIAMLNEYREGTDLRSIEIDEINNMNDTIVNQSIRDRIEQDYEKRMDNLQTRIDEVSKEAERLGL